MSQALNYDDFAHQYASTRWALPWITAVLARQVGLLPPHATLVEIGCGTGNYIIALSEMFPACACKAFDLSPEMLKVASSRSTRVQFVPGDADAQFPCAAEEADFAYLVDVVHHLRNLDNLFRESARIMKPGAVLAIVTDSEANIRNRSLSRYFPEILDGELARYPAIGNLDSAARRAGLKCDAQEPAEGDIDLDEAFIAKLEQKCSSALRLISPEAHEAGIARVRDAQRRGEKWHSCYTALRYSKG
ncbi:MAG: methyltransferase domain-containing protein [Kiritimatiellae bacterium]|nr:methyltransferase domain-containing protein [Kiritimatiellia bacterium]